MVIGISKLTLLSIVQRARVMLRCKEKAVTESVVSFLCNGFFLCLVCLENFPTCMDEKEIPLPTDHVLSSVQVSLSLSTSTSP